MNLPTKLFQEAVKSDAFIDLTFKDPFLSQNPKKIFYRQVYIKSEILYQKTVQLSDKAVHQNLSEAEALGDIHDEALHYRKGLLRTKEADHQFLMNKNQIKHIPHQPSSKSKSLLHNVPKQHILPEGTPIPFLVELGIMNQQGKVYPKKQDKFRQINRFLEFVRDLLPDLHSNKMIRLIDFGCGKGYLTFALYHYLSQHFTVEMTGVDLKREVIERCQEVAKRLKYRNLKFIYQNMNDFETDENIDVVLSLHACDTATDIVLQKGVRWGAKVILSAPCCQHELFNQIQNDTLKPLLKYGILKERFSALLTDSLRALYLEMNGYQTQVLEFVETEHTAKNLLLRAIKKGKSAEQKEQLKLSLETLKREFKINPFIFKNNFS